MFTRHRHWVILLAPLGWGVVQVQAQKDHGMMLFGIVEDLKSGKPLSNACVRFATDSVMGDSVFTDGRGAYQTFIPLGDRYRLTYAADGHHVKSLIVDATGEMEPADRQREWNLRIDITLASSALDLPEDLLDMPFGIASWVPAMHEFQWDGPYTERYREQFKLAVKAAEKK
ncbi:MAG TPA: hypothetical protein PLB89_16665 [Flavobacteriales bacterium]|nr:hypothetical protein [Flavobacteriales bacterium]